MLLLIPPEKLSGDYDDAVKQVAKESVIAQKASIRMPGMYAIKVRM